jgi:hypothetical protein
MEIPVVPENVIPAEPNTSSGELAGAFVTDNGERRWSVVRLGIQVCRFEMVAWLAMADPDGLKIRCREPAELRARPPRAEQDR